MKAAIQTRRPLDRTTPIHEVRQFGALINISRLAPLSSAAVSRSWSHGANSIQDLLQEPRPPPFQSLTCLGCQARLLDFETNHFATLGLARSANRSFGNAQNHTLTSPLCPSGAAVANPSRRIIVELTGPLATALTLAGPLPRSTSPNPFPELDLCRRRHLVSFTHINPPSLRSPRAPNYEETLRLSPKSLFFPLVFFYRIPPVRNLAACPALRRVSIRIFYFSPGSSPSISSAPSLSASVELTRLLRVLTTLFSPDLPPPA